MAERHNERGEADKAVDAPLPHTSSRPPVSSIDPEHEREEVRRKNGNGMSSLNSGVSVEKAEADFAELQRELSHLSEISHAKSHTSRRVRELDIEKEATVYTDTQNKEPQEDRFDLETILRSGLDKEKEAGIRPKHIGVYWDRLTVKGIGGVSNFVETFPDAFVNFVNFWTPIMRILGKGQKGTEVVLLDNFKGLVKPGEMVLVLGKPGSGCTTFLKSITNLRHGYTDVSGEVFYGPFTAKDFKKYRGEAVYNAEDDLHHGTLTVEQTLGFALDTKIPAKLPFQVSRKVFKEQVLTLLLKMFNIEHTRKTAVGGEMMRGVSGGERKRVSIAEMMVTNACILSWDNSTRGLDASTALDFIKSLRITTDLYKTTTFVSLYQASENIYKLFDKTLVIDSGKQVFFGPASEARAYFEGLGFLPRPRQTTPDYVTGCTDEFERSYSPGFSPGNAPHSPETLVEAFQKSPHNQQLLQEMLEYQQNLASEASKHDDFRVAVKESKHFGAAGSVYSTGFPGQVWALMQRQFAIKSQDRLGLSVSWFRSVVIAIILGTLWYDLDDSSKSAFSKGGLLFISLMFNALQAFSELGNTMTGRAIANKHRLYAFHRPSALWIAQIFVDVVFSSAQILLFAIIVYFMTGLKRTAAAFFTYYLLIICGNLAMTLFFRILGCVSPSFDHAIKFAVVLITLLIVTSGYLIQYQSQHVWIRWIFWINALGLSFSSLMINEFSDTNLTCTSESLIPSGDGYANITHQVCTLSGSTAGSATVRGDDYIKAAFSYVSSDIWKHWGIVMGLIGFFFILNIVLGEVVRFGASGNSAKVFQRPNAERTVLNKALDEKRSKKNTNTDAYDQRQDLEMNSASILTWEDVNYDVPVPGGTRRLLSKVYGYCRPGQLTALMGASGAGKTTLLDVLAARKNIGTITGDILVDGVKPGKEFQRSTSYAEQLDMHDPTQTVREALRFSANLRQPFETPLAEKYSYVEEIISLLEMEHIADCIIGSPEFGLTVEQRKRVTIGVELAAKPELLLFLDEPTSGLDSQSAYNIVRFLRKLASTGQAILCTVHQPNAALFENFDRLLLLETGGRTVYFGEIGPDAAVLRAYLKRYGAAAGDSDNVAEFMLDAIGAGIAPRIGDKDWGDIWEASPEFEQTKDEIALMKKNRQGTIQAVDRSEEKEYASPLRHQLKVVMRRMNLSYWRSPDYVFTRVFNHVIVAVINGLIFLNLDSSRISLTYKVFVVFQITVLPALIIAQVEVMYFTKRMIFFREQSSKMYNALTFAASMVVAEMPYSILCAVCFFLPLYYMPGFQRDTFHAGFQFFMILITELFSVTLGQMLASLAPTPFFSSQIDPFIMINFMLFCGVTISPKNMPAGWRDWFYQIDPFTRLVSAAGGVALHGVQVVCKASELNPFPAPEGEDCGTYMQSFFNSGGAGYITNNSTSSCEYCAYKFGDDYLRSVGLNYANHWRDAGIFMAFIGSNMAILFLGCRFLNYNRR